MQIEGYDLVMLGILAAAAVLGYFKGMVWQLAWLAGIAASSVVALRFSGQVAPFFGQQAPWNRIVAMLALYVATSLAVWIVFRVVAGAINAVHLSAFDHQLGLLFGLAKGVLLCIVVTFFAVTLAPAYRHQIVGSRSGRIVAELIVRADEILPPDIVATVQPFVRQFEDQFRQPPAAGAAAAPGVLAQPSALKALWDGITSSAAWTATPTQAVPEQGTGFADRASWSGTPPAGGQQPAQPSRPTTSGFTNRPPLPGLQPAAPGPFPVGAQSPLPIR